MAEGRLEIRGGQDRFGGLALPPVRVSPGGRVVAPGQDGGRQGPDIQDGRKGIGVVVIARALEQADLDGSTVMLAR